MNRKAIIFDLDGVLVSTDELHYLAWKKIADSRGIYFDRQINHRLRGVSRMESLDIILERYQGDTLTDREKESLAEEKNEIYKGLLMTLTRDSIPMQTREVLSQLKKRGYRLAIGSSSKNAKRILQTTDLIDYFDAISDGTNIKHSKPNPEVFVQAANFLDIRPESCIVVEDSEAGIDAANAAGMFSVAMGGGKDYSKANLSIQSLDELLHMNLSSCR